MSIDRKTPPEPWTMHPDDIKVSPGLKGHEQRSLESILESVQSVLQESRDIKEYGQRCADTALRAVEQIPRLQARMNRVEVIAIGATLVNIVLLFVASSCGR